VAAPPIETQGLAHVFLMAATPWAAWSMAVVALDDRHGMTPVKLNIGDDCVEADPARRRRAEMFHYRRLSAFSVARLEDMGRRN